VDPNFSTTIPSLLNWSETNLVDISTSDGLYGSTGVYLGAHVPGEQRAYTPRMGYQAARLGAVYGRWYLTSGNATHKDIAYRNLNYNTYMMASNGMAADGPTVAVGNWFGDCYGEAARMYFHGMAGLPEYAPPGENHILYSRATLKNVAYGSSIIQYTPANGDGIEFLRVAFLPSSVTVGGVAIGSRGDTNAQGYVISSLGGGDYAVKVRRTSPGTVILSMSDAPVGTPILSVR